MQYLVIYDSTKTKKLSLGDVIRFLDVIKFQDFLIATNTENNNFFYHFNKKKVLNIFQNDFDYKNYKIINLNLGKKKDNTFFDINDYITFENFSKVSTYELVKIFQSSTKNKTNGTNSNLKLNKNSLVGFNWIVPKEWEIKSLPMEKWIDLKKKIYSKYNIKISWQKNDNLENYVDWIKGCDLLISIVGLGVHIANFFNKRIIMLSGPTDFLESNYQKNIKKILPENFCEYRPCNLINGINNCGCMGEIKVSKIFHEIEKMFL